MKNTSSKLKQRSNRIVSKLGFSNTQANPIEIEEAEDEVSMHREEIVFTNESKKQGSSTAFEGGHSFNYLSELENGHFSAGQDSIGQTLPTLLLFNSSCEHFTSHFHYICPFYFPYFCLSQVSHLSTLHLEAREVPSLDLPFLDQATPHVEPQSRPPTKSDVVVSRSTVSHLLSLDLLFLSSIQDVFHAAMVVL